MRTLSPHQTTMTCENVSAIILAGGKSRRFNFIDKGLVSWRGKPLLEHVAASIASQVDDIVLSCNQHIERYQQFGYPLFQDKLPDFQGPLAGIQASLPNVRHDYVLICPCDTTQLPPTLVERLLSAMLSNGVDIAYPKTEQRDHYLPVLIKSNLQSSINAYLEGNDRSMRGWYQTLSHIAVPFSSPTQQFSNFNDPRDLTTPEQLADIE